MRGDRLLSLLLLLQTRGRMPAHELAGLLEVSERTIYRDLDALSAAGVPVYAERGPGGGCALLESYRTDLTGLTEAEVAALFMGGPGGPLRDLGVGRALEAAWLKLSAALSTQQRRDAERVRGRIYLDAAGWFQRPEPVPYLGVLQEAVWQDRSVDLHYRRADGSELERVVDPYGLVAKASVWYLVAAHRDPGGHEAETGGPLEKVHVYRVTRVIKAEVREERFERPAGFGLAGYWAERIARYEASFPRYPVRLRVAPEVRSALGRGAYARVEVGTLADSEGWVTATLVFESLEAARAHVFEFGAAVEVLEPAELRASVQEAAGRIARLYAQRKRG